MVILNKIGAILRTVGVNSNLKHTEFVCLYYKLVSNYG